MFILRNRQVKAGDVERIRDACDAITAVPIWAHVARVSCTWSRYVCTVNAWKTVVVTTARDIWKRYNGNVCALKGKNIRDWGGFSMENNQSDHHVISLNVHITHTATQIYCTWTSHSNFNKWYLFLSSHIQQKTDQWNKPRFINNMWCLTRLALNTAVNETVIWRVWHHFNMQNFNVKIVTSRDILCKILRCHLQNVNRGWDTWDWCMRIAIFMVNMGWSCHGRNKIMFACRVLFRCLFIKH